MFSCSKTRMCERLNLLPKHTSIGIFFWVGGTRNSVGHIYCSVHSFGPPLHSTCI
ncbi:hypothetical protein Plhal304r1_c011g0044631 [Plasmopara halstedii]